MVYQKVVGYVNRCTKLEYDIDVEVNKVKTKGV